MELLAGLKDSNKKDKERKQKAIIDLLSGDTNLRSKRELIENFILDNLPNIENSEDVEDEFDKFWEIEQEKALKDLISENNLSLERTNKLIEDYLFAEREPLKDDILNLIEGKQPTLLQRKKTGETILTSIVNYVETFINGIFD